VPAGTSALRGCVVAALVAGGLSLANAAIGLADTDSDDPQSAGDYAAIVVFSAALVGAAIASGSLRRLGAARSRRAAGLGLATAATGGALAGIGNLLEDGFGVSAFGLLFALGGLILIIGLLAAGVALTIAPGWRLVGVALLLVAVGIAVGEEPGFALAGLSWTASAVVLAGRDRGVRSTPPARPAPPAAVATRGSARRGS
jgi:hypothetical protein